MHQHRLNLLKYEFVHIWSNFYWLVMQICKVPKNHWKIWMTFWKIRFCLDNPIFSRFYIFMKFWIFAGNFFILLGKLCKNPCNILKYRALSFIKWKQNPNILFRSDLKVQERADFCAFALIYANVSKILMMSFC